MSTLHSIFPARCDWPQAVDDVLKHPVDAISIRLVSGAKNIDQIPSYAGLKSLWCFDIDAGELDSICSCTSLESLYVDNIKTRDLSSLKRLAGLRVLGVEACAKVTSLVDLSELHSLVGLGITHFKNVHDLTPLAGLHRLRALAVAGSMWTRMQINSFAPVSGLEDLELLHLMNIRADDMSLKPLAGLKKLRKLEIANFYPTSEFAWLSQRLRSTECDWFRPYVEISSLACRLTNARGRWRLLRRLPNSAGMKSVATEMVV
jgi:hypothetical protein